MKTKEVTWEDVGTAVRDWARTLASLGAFDFVVGISRGGIVPGFMLSQMMKLCFVVVDPFVEGGLKEFASKRIIMIDDIEDTGATLSFFGEQATKYKLADFVPRVIVRKPEEELNKVWYIFPWETETDTAGGREQATVAILRSIGENPMREGLVDTPKRVAKLWGDLTAGYQQKPEEIMRTDFSSEKYDEMIVLKDIRYFSTCEHHLLPFYGKVHFAYIPDKKIVGVSKIIRLIDVFSRRLQVQERMTMQIGQTFEEIVKPKGVGIVVEGLHLCMMLRGVKRENPMMKTSYLGGALRNKPEAREEFLKLIK